MIAFSLKNKITFLLIGVIFGLVLMVVLILTYLSHQEIERNLGTRLKKAQLIVEEFQELKAKEIHVGIQMITSMSLLRALMTSGEPAALLQFAERMRKENEKDLLIITDGQGKVLAWASEGSQRGSLSTHPAIQQSLRGKKATGLLDAEGAIYQIRSAPISLGSNLLGTIIIGYRIDNAFAEYLKTVTEGEASIFLNERLIASTLTEDASRRVQGEIGQHIKQPMGERFDLTLRSERFISILMPFEDRGTILLQQSWDRATRFLRMIRLLVLVVTFLVAGLTAMLSYRLLRRMLKPIDRLVNASKTIAAGNLSVSLDVSQKDEIGTLTKAFNQMVHDLKEQRAQLVDKNYVDSMIANMTDSLIVVAPEGVVKTVNKAAIVLLGYTEEEIIGQPFEKFTEEEFRFETSWLHEVVEIGNISPVEKLYLARDGKKIPVLFSSSVMRDENGRIQGIICVAKDITERKRAEKQLAEQAQELAHSNAELQQFAYVASHDLQEPLRMVGSYTQLLAKRYKGKLDSDADDFIAYAVDGVTRMEKLIKDLLAYSRVGSKGKDLQPTDSKAVFDSAFANLRAAIGESGARVTHDPLPTVMADVSQLGQLFQNLIGNAIKFHGEEPPSVHVSAQRNGDEWIFSVRDNGVGIDPKYSERIFIIFQRLHSRGSYPGTGIGLAICKKIVDRHGGRIWVESQPGGGSMFYFTIPKKGEETDNHVQSNGR